MTVLVNLVLFVLSGAIVWFFAGRLIDSVDRVARRFRQSGFTVAFFVLGFLTTIGEISVMVNATINGVPEVSAGNLVGASIVLLLFLVPVLAILGNGIRLKDILTRPGLAVTLFAVTLPTLCLLDGEASRTEGLICVMTYGALLYLIPARSRPSVEDVVEEVAEELAHRRRSTVADWVNIAGGGVLILVAGNVLVAKTAYFSALLGVPSSVIGLLVLSLGTNIPELVVAMRSVHKHHKDIAFGNYLGSALTNTLVFGGLALLNGAFAVERIEFVVAGIVMVIGFTGLYLFAVSASRLSRNEGTLLVSLYGLFLLLQLGNLVRAATD
jgi:cation:H+ antiporter